MWGAADDWSDATTFTTATARTNARTHGAAASACRQCPGDAAVDGSAEFSRDAAIGQEGLSRDAIAAEVAEAVAQGLS